MVPSEGGREGEGGEGEGEGESVCVWGVGWGERRENTERGVRKTGEKYVYKITTEVLNTLLRYVAELKMENW